jgi:hypothetical protein
MSLTQQDILKQSVIRYQQEKLFAYYDQLDKKQDFLKTLQKHKHMIIHSISLMIVTENAKYWVDKKNHALHHLSKSENFTEIKEHIETFFDNDFFEIFNEVPVETLSSFIEIIDSLEVPIRERNIVLPSSINNYLEQFKSNDGYVEDVMETER